MSKPPVFEPVIEGMTPEEAKAWRAALVARCQKPSNRIVMWQSTSGNFLASLNDDEGPIIDGGIYCSTQAGATMLLVSRVRGGLGVVITPAQLSVTKETS